MFTLVQGVPENIPLVFLDVKGRKVSGPGGSTVTSSNPAAGTVTLSEDGQSVLVTSLDATSPWTASYSGSGLSFSTDIQNAADTPVSGSFDTADATLA